MKDFFLHTDKRKSHSEEQNYRELKNQHCEKRISQAETNLKHCRWLETIIHLQVVIALEGFRKVTANAAKVWRKLGEGKG